MDTLFEADELTVTLKDGAVERLTEKVTETLDVVLTLAEIDALWLPDADNVGEKLALSFIEDDTLGVPLPLGAPLFEGELLSERAPKLRDTLGLASCETQYIWEDRQIG